MAEANHTSRVPEYDDNGNAHGLTRAPSTIIEPQGPCEDPHSIPTPTTNDVMHSVSRSRSPTMPDEPPPPHVVTTCGTSPTPSWLDWAAEVNEAVSLSPAVHNPGIVPPGPAVDTPPRTEMDLGDTTFTTPTTSGTTSPAHNPVLIHPTSIDPPRGPTATAVPGHFDPATSTSTPPTNTDPINTSANQIHVAFINIMPVDSVAVNPIWRAHQTFDWESFGPFWPRTLVFSYHFYFGRLERFQDATGTVAFEGGGHVTGRIE